MQADAAYFGHWVLCGLVWMSPFARCVAGRFLRMEGRPRASWEDDRREGKPGACLFAGLSVGCQNSCNVFKVTGRGPTCCSHPLPMHHFILFDKTTTLDKSRGNSWKVCYESHGRLVETHCIIASSFWCCALFSRWFSSKMWDGTLQMVQPWFKTMNGVRGFFPAPCDWAYVQNCACKDCDEDTP
jgi:hypothetical protein